MKTRVPLLLILAALAWAQNAAGQAQPGPAAAAWARYTYPGEEFSVELPGMPQVFHTSRNITDAPSDTETERVRVFGLYADRVVYMVVAFDRPRPAESDGRLAGYVWGERGLTPKGEVRQGGVSGRAYDVGMNFKGAARLFRTKHHAYLLKAFSDAEGRHESVMRFLDSFAPGAKPAGARVDDGPRLAPPRGQPIPGFAGVGTGPGIGGGAAGTPLKTGEVSRKAVIVFKPAPDFTEEARRNNVFGTVRLRAVLSSEGKVQNVSVVKGVPDGLTEKAVSAARHILFFPAVKDGRPVSQYVVLEYNFNVH